MKIDTAVLPIAGLGTRFLPLSKVIPKEFFPLGKKPIIQYIVEEAIEAGVKKIVFVISPEKKEIFEKYILKYFYEEDKNLLSVLKKRKKEKAIETLNSIPKIDYEYVIQRKPLGDGDAILRAEKLVGKKPFLVLFGDDISWNNGKEEMASQLVKTFKKVKQSCLCLYKKPKKELFAYGVPKIVPLPLRGAITTKQSFANTRAKRKSTSAIYKICNIIEKPKKNPPSSFALVGKYVLTPDILFYLKKVKLQNGEVILANAIRDMISESKDVYGLAVQGKWLECGIQEKWIKNFVFLSKK